MHADGRLVGMPSITGRQLVRERAGLSNAEIFCKINALTGVAYIDLGLFMGVKAEIEGCF